MISTRLSTRAPVVTGRNRAAPALVTPQSAVVYRNGKAGVFVLDAAGAARFRPVTTGARVDSRVEITSGLREGERVVVGGAGFLADGDKVRVATAQPKR